MDGMTFFSQPCEPLSSFLLSITLDSSEDSDHLLATSVTQMSFNIYTHRPKKPVRPCLSEYKPYTNILHYRSAIDFCFLFVF